MIKSDEEMAIEFPDRIKCTTEVYFEHEGSVNAFDTPVYDLDHLGHGFSVDGPAIILNKTSTIIVEPECKAHIAEEGSVTIDIHHAHDKKIEEYKSIEEVPLDPIELSIFG